MPACRASGRSKGLAFVQYADSEAAAAALEALDGTIFQGRLLHVLPAHKPHGQAEADPSAAQVGMQTLTSLMTRETCSMLNLCAAARVA